MPSGNQIKAGEAWYELSLKDAKALQAVENFKKQAKAMGLVLEEVGKKSQAKGFGGFAKDIVKDRRESGESAAQKFLSGGLVNAGLDALGAGVTGIILEQVGKSLSDATAKAVEFSDAMRNGKANAADVMEELAIGLPIAGEFFAAGRNIHEMLTGEKHDIQAINEEAKRTTELYDARYKSAMSYAQALKDIHLEIDKINNTTSAVGKDSFTRERAALQNERADLQKQRSENRKAAEAEVGTSYDPGIQFRRDQANASQAKVDELQQQLDNVRGSVEALGGKWDPKKEAERQKAYGGKSLQEKIDEAQKLADTDQRLYEMGKKQKELDIAGREAGKNSLTGAKESDVAAREKDLRSRESQALAQVQADGIEKLKQIDASAKQADLEAAGLHADTRVAVVKEGLRREIDAINKEAERNESMLGLDDPSNSRRIGIEQTAVRARIALQRKAEAEIAAIQNGAQADRDNEYAETLANIQRAAQAKQDAAVRGAAEGAQMASRLAGNNLSAGTFNAREAARLGGEFGSKAEQIEKNTRQMATHLHKLASPTWRD